MNIAIILAALSRMAGGLLSSVSSLSRSLAAIPSLEVAVLGIRDRNTNEDVKAWAPLTPLIFEPDFPHFLRHSSQLKEHLFNNSYDIVHSETVWLYPALAISKWAEKTGKAYIVSTHGMLDPWALSNAKWKKKAIGTLYANNHLQNAACLHALCHSELRSLRKFGLRNPVCIIPNGVDLPRIKNHEKPPWKDSDHKVLLFLSRLHPKKNLPRLLYAWSSVQKQLRHAKNWMLVIAGWDQAGHERILKDLSEDLSLQNNVLFIGPQYGVKKNSCYFHADAFCLPSLSEGLPMVVLEAWSYSLPVVMTAECNLPEGFLGNAAIQVTSDSQGIAAGLKILMEMTDSERKAIGRNGHDLVSRKFAWSNIADNMASVYSWILGEGIPPDVIHFD